MSSLTIAAREATGETGKIAWSAELTDADGVPVAGHITSGANTGQIVQPSRGYTDTDGDVTLDLEANANITPANTYWTVFVGPRSFLVSKGSGTETLTAALASDPGTLGTTALAAHIADTVDAHDASAISFSPTGSIAGTDVQTAVAEVATDAAAAVTAASILTKLLTVDGAGSGLDADLLDGQSSAYYATVLRSTNAQTDDYTLVLGDAGKIVEMNKSTAVTLTVPLNSSVAFSVGTVVDVLATGAGQVTVAATGGVTINATPGLKLTDQWAAASLIKRATDTWVLVGRLSA